jgi:murein hydrolase activator
VAYAGEFRGYGLLLIIEHGDEYHSLLTGLSRLDVVPGQWVLAGEPVGVMGGSETETPELNVEIRRKGQPVNPLPWLAVDRG